MPGPIQSQQYRAEHGLQGKGLRHGTGQSDLDPCVDQGLDKGKDIGRAATAQTGNRIKRGLVQHKTDPDRIEDAGGHGQILGTHTLTGA